MLLPVYLHRIGYQSLDTDLGALAKEHHCSEMLRNIPGTPRQELFCICPTSLAVVEGPRDVSCHTELPGDHLQQGVEWGDNKLHDPFLASCHIVEANL